MWWSCNFDRMTEVNNNKKINFGGLPPAPMTDIYYMVNIVHPYYYYKINKNASI